MPNPKAVAITVISIVAAVAAIALFPVDWAVHWPLVLFYALLLVNTYFSVSYFSNIIPANALSQRAIDGMLVVLYLVLATALGNSLHFMVALTIYFAIATLKYAAALPLVTKPALLYRKVKIDAMGAVGSALALCGVIFSSAFAASALWTIVFGVATVYVLFVKPLYADRGTHH